jgi:hypothetical protein
MDSTTSKILKLETYNNIDLATIKNYKYVILDFLLSLSNSKEFLIFLTKYQSFLNKMEYNIPTCLRLTIVDCNANNFTEFLASIQKRSDLSYFIKYEGLCLAHKYNELTINDLQLFEEVPLYSYLYSNRKVEDKITRTIKLNDQHFPEPMYIKELGSKTNLEYLKLKNFNFNLYKGVFINKADYEAGIGEYLGLAKVIGFDIALIYMKIGEPANIFSSYLGTAYCNPKCIALSLVNLFNFFIDNGVKNLLLRLSFNKELRGINIDYKRRTVQDIINTFKQCFEFKNKISILNCLKFNSLDMLVSIDKSDYITISNNERYLLLLLYLLKKKGFNLKKNIIVGLQNCLKNIEIKYLK